MNNKISNKSDELGPNISLTYYKPMFCKQILF